jgi:hypothetical protein
VPLGGAWSLAAASLAAAAGCRPPAGCLAGWPALLLGTEGHSALAAGRTLLDTSMPSDNNNAHVPGSIPPSAGIQHARACSAPAPIHLPPLQLQELLHATVRVWHGGAHGSCRAEGETKSAESHGSRPISTSSCLYTGHRAVGSGRRPR